MTYEKLSMLQHGNDARFSEWKFIRRWNTGFGWLPDRVSGWGIMPEVSWTSDTRAGGVTGLVDLFRTTFEFGINSSRYFYSTRQVIGLTVRRGRFDVQYVRGGGRPTNIVLVSTHFSDKFWYINYFNPSYGLKDIKFTSLINFKSIKSISYLLILLLINIINNPF